jgi:serine/threonine-protein kinase
MAAASQTGVAFVPPIAAPGTVRRTVVAMRIPQGRAPSFAVPPPPPMGEVLGEAQPLETVGEVRMDLSAETGSGALARAPAVAAIKSEADAGGAFFPAGGLARPRGEPALAPSSWEATMIGRVLDQRYRIEDCIGAGGMGVVYRARHVIIDKPVAIKMLRAEVASQADVIKRFLLEAQLASRVKHPNVVDISDYGQIPGQTAYYVMEYLSGETLAHRIKAGGRLDPALAIDLAIQTAQALQAAHASKIIHRDLKSENIFLCEHPEGGLQAKILDFGIARIRDRKTGLTAMGALIGTPAYMSPEQAQGAEVDERSDLYALGVICFEMLTGRVPFKAPTVAMVLNAQIFDAPPALREVDPTMQELPNVEHVIRRLLAKRREERPSEAAEVIHLLRTAAEVDLNPSAALSTAGSSKRRPTVTIGSWSVAESPSGRLEGVPGMPRVGEARTTPRPELDAAMARTVSASGRIERRPSVIVPSGTPVERIAAPPSTRSPFTGELDQRPYPTGGVQAVRPSGPPRMLIIAAAASIGAAITVTLYKQVWRRSPAPVIQPAELPVAMKRLQFDSNPSGAEVITEQGERWGVTPFTRMQAADSPAARVVFRLPGHEDQSVAVPAGESMLLNVQLRSLAPATVLAPGVGPGTAGTGTPEAATGPSETPSTEPATGKPAASSRTKPATKPKTGTGSKPVATPGETKPTSEKPPAEEPPAPKPPPEEDELDMGDLKNPFRKK